MDPVQKLLAIEEIKKLKARYWRFVDTRRWDDWGSVFARDASISFEEVDRSGSPAEFVPWVAAFLEGAVTVHRGYAPEIDILSETEARGIWAFEDRLFWHPDKPGPGGMLTLQGDGHYNETYRCIDGEWKIQSMRVTRLREVTTGGKTTLKL